MQNSGKNIFFQKNTPFGLFMGISFMLASYVYYKSGRAISLNPQLNNLLMLLSVAGIFIGVRKYREEVLQGTISYGKALGVCIYLLAVAVLLYGFFIYGLYHRHPELQENYISTVNFTLQEVYKDSPLVENMKTLMQAYTTPVTIALAEVFNKIFTGFIFSLFLAGILRRTSQR